MQSLKVAMVCLLLLTACDASATARPQDHPPASGIVSPSPTIATGKSATLDLTFSGALTGKVTQATAQCMDWRTDPLLSKAKMPQFNATFQFWLGNESHALSLTVRNYRGPGKYLVPTTYPKTITAATPPLAQIALNGPPLKSAPNERLGARARTPSSVVVATDDKSGEVFASSIPASPWLAAAPGATVSVAGSWRCP